MTTKARTVPEVRSIAEAIRDFYADGNSRADLARASGVSYVGILGIERGAEPKLSTARKLAAALGLSLDVLEA